MQLYIVRHGIAIDREDPKCPSEAERYLTEEGVDPARIAIGHADSFPFLDYHLAILRQGAYVRVGRTACC